MSAPEEKIPFPRRFSVQLKVRTEADWFSVDCDLCHKILASGDTASLGQALEDVLRRLVAQHCHEV